MKQTSADGSVASAHVRVGHRQAPNTENPSILDAGVFYCLQKRPGSGQPDLKHTTTEASTVVEFYRPTSLSLTVQSGNG